MAWVRIHDGAMGNLKILRLSDSAFRLWVKGLSYCQTHLTDGLIPREWLHEVRAKRGDVDMLSVPLVEGKAPLWEPIDGFGFKCHDYLIWNDCREKVVERQDAARQRKADYEAKKKAERAGKRGANGTRSEHVPNASGTRPLTKPNQTIQIPPKEQEVLPAAPSKRPIFCGQRLTVFEWMLDEYVGMLGDHLENFDLHDWFFKVDEMAVQRGLVIPKRDGGEWLQSQFVAEAQRRGIALRLATAPKAGKVTSNMAAALENIAREAS